MNLNQLFQPSRLEIYNANHFDFGLSPIDSIQKFHTQYIQEIFNPSPSDKIEMIRIGCLGLSRILST